jgi:nitrogen-specific signal transduction histidine kinase
MVTIDSDGKVVLANEAANQLLRPGGSPLQGQAIRSYLPPLQTVLKAQVFTCFSDYPAKYGEKE